MSNRVSKRPSTFSTATTNKQTLARLNRKLDSIDAEFSSRGKQVIIVVKSSSSSVRKKK